MSKSLKKKFMNAPRIAPKPLKLTDIGELNVLIRMLGQLNAWNAFGLSLFATLKFLKNKDNSIRDSVGVLVTKIHCSIEDMIDDNLQLIVGFSQVIIKEDSRDILCEYALKVACECGLVEGIDFKMGDLLKCMSAEEKMSKIVGDIKLTQKGLDILDKLSNSYNAIFSSGVEFAAVCDEVASKVLEELESIIKSRA